MSQFKSVLVKFSDGSSVLSNTTGSCSWGGVVDSVKHHGSHRVIICTIRFYRCYALIKHASSLCVRSAARHEDRKQNKGGCTSRWELRYNWPGQVQVQDDGENYLTRTVKNRPFELRELFVRIFLVTRSNCSFEDDCQSRWST